MIIKSPVVLDTAYNNKGTNWSLALPAVDAVICKASESIYGRDTEFPSTWPQLADLNLPRAAYHFYRKAFPSAWNAKNFAAAINANGGLKAGDKLVLDVEEQGCSISAILDTCYNIELLLGQRPILYSRAEILNALSFAKLNQSQRAYVKSLNVWTAGYPNSPDLFDTPPLPYLPDPSRYGKVVLWQYAGDRPHNIPGVLGGLDFNWIDPAFFQQWKQDTGAIIPPISGGSMFTGKVTATAGLNIRNAPINGTPYSTKLQFNDLVEADRIESNWWHLTRITRGTSPVPLPGPVCWASGAYILNTTVTPPPPPPPPPPVDDPIVLVTATHQSGAKEEFIPKP